MNIKEFKAWFEGFTENLSGPPNRAQWARIQERISEIDDKPAPDKVIIKEVERYVPRLRDRIHPPYWTDRYTTDVGVGDFQVWSQVGKGEAEQLLNAKDNE